MKDHHKGLSHGALWFGAASAATTYLYIKFNKKKYVGPLTGAAPFINGMFGGILGALVGANTGKSTYHILLTQIMYFAILIAIYGDHYGTSILGVATDDLNVFINLFVNWSICVPIGVIWWSIENSIRSFSSKKSIIRKNEQLEQELIH